MSRLKSITSRVNSRILLISRQIIEYAKLHPILNTALDMRSVVRGGGCQSRRELTLAADGCPSSPNRFHAVPSIQFGVKRNFSGIYSTIEFMLVNLLLR